MTYVSVQCVARVKMLIEKEGVSVELEDLSSPLEDVEEAVAWPAEGLYWLLYLVVPSAIPRSTLRAYGKISVYLSCVVMGFILPAPLVIFAQAKFFNTCTTPVPGALGGAQIVRI